jgi:hypothetical protein
MRCFGAGVPSYFAGRGSLGAFPWFVPLTLWWVHWNTHSFKCVLEDYHQHPFNDFLSAGSAYPGGRASTV